MRFVDGDKLLEWLEHHLLKEIEIDLLDFIVFIRVGRFDVPDLAAENARLKEALLTIRYYDRESFEEDYHSMQELAAEALGTAEHHHTAPADRVQEEL